MKGRHWKLLVTRWGSIKCTKALHDAKCASYCMHSNHPDDGISMDGHQLMFSSTWSPHGCFLRGLYCISSVLSFGYIPCCFPSVSTHTANNFCYFYCSNGCRSTLWVEHVQMQSMLLVKLVMTATSATSGCT